MTPTTNVRVAKAVYLILSLFICIYTGVVLFSSAPTAEQAHFESWLSGIEMQLWKGENPWGEKKFPQVTLRIDSAEYNCCGSLESDAARERLIRVLSLIRETKLVNERTDVDGNYLIEISLNQKPLFRSRFVNNSIKHQTLVNLMRIYHQMN